MVVPNQFLLAGINGQHVLGCCCDECQNSKVENLLTSGRNVAQLHNDYFVRLRHNQELQLNQLFRSTMERIIHGNAYKRKCTYPYTRFSSFGCWLRKNSTNPGFNEIGLKKMRTEITHVTKVHENWRKIVGNLCNSSMINIDARKFSIQQFYRAINYRWCVRYNNLHGSNNNQIDRPTYSEEKYIDILRYIHDSSILEETGYDPAQAALICSRLKRDLTQSCEPHNT